MCIHKFYINIIFRKFAGITREAIVLIVLAAQIWDDNNLHVSSAPSEAHNSHLVVYAKCLSVAVIGF